MYLWNEIKKEFLYTDEEARERLYVSERQRRQPRSFYENINTFQPIHVRPLRRLSQVPTPRHTSQYTRDEVRTLRSIIMYGSRFAARKRQLEPMDLRTQTRQRLESVCAPFRVLPLEWVCTHCINCHSVAAAVGWIECLSAAWGNGEHHFHNSVQLRACR